MNEITLTVSATKQISMIGKINEPFDMKQVCIKKGISTKDKEEFEKNVRDTNSKLIYITREYDGTERYWLCYKSNIDELKFSQGKDIIYL